MTTKAKKTAAARVAAVPAKLAAIAPAAMRDGVSRAELIAAGKAFVGKPMAKDESDAYVAYEKRLATFRAECVIGWLASNVLCRENSDEARIEWARGIAAKKNPDSKAKADARRTPAQHTAYDSATKRWNRLRAEAGYAATDARGGNNTTGKNGTGKEPEPGSNEPDAPAETPTMEDMAKSKAKTANDVNERLFAMYQTALGYINNNAKVASAKSKTVVEQWGEALRAAGIIPAE